MQIKTFIVKLFMLLACGLLLVQMGCVAAVIAGAAAGAGTVVYIKGQLEETINASTSDVYKATLSAFNELHLPLVGDKHDAMAAEIKSRFADDKTVWISIESITAVSSKITIRVGTFGDEHRSRTILTTIHKYLPKQSM